MSVKHIPTKGTKTMNIKTYACGFIKLNSLLLMAIVCLPAQAGELSVPNTFNSGTPAVAAQVNANFTAAETAVSDNNTKINDLLLRVTALEEENATLEASLQSLTDNVSFANAIFTAAIGNLQDDSVSGLGEYLSIGTDARGNPVVRFSGVNVHVNNGTGTTGGAVNGLGNLVIGYDEINGFQPTVIKSGSHNLIVGMQHNYGNYGGVVAGLRNNITGNYATVTGGRENTASGELSSVTGGFRNEASARWSSVSGGADREASDESDWSAGGLTEGF